MKHVLDIEVVVLDSEKLFKFGEFYFDLLESDPFEGGVLTIVRKGNVIQRTDRIGWYGTHGEAICFVAYSGVFQNILPITSLHPSVFEESDTLNLTFEGEDSFDLIDYLHESSKNGQILDAVAEEMSDKPLSLDSFMNLIEEKSKMETTESGSKIIRL